MKRNKLLALLLVLVLAFSFALVACNQHDCAKDGHEYGEDGKCKYCGQQKPEQPGPGPDVDVPVEEGKVTFYLTVADGSVAIPSYGSIFLIGAFTGWDPATNSVEMKKLGDTSVYYATIVYDESSVEYKVGLGYNASSGLPADKLGIDWKKVPDECPTDLGNLSFTYNKGDKKVELGTFTFSEALTAPETVDAIDLRVTFSEALGANAEVYIMGGFNGWDVSKAKASPLKTQNEQNQEVTDRSVWSISLTDVLCTNYDYKILVYENGSKAANLTWQQPKKDAEGNPVEPAEMEEIGIWDRFVTTPDWTGHKETDKLMGYTVISAGKDNLPMSIVKADGVVGYIDLADTVSEAIDDPTDPVAKKGIDLSKAELLEGQDNGKANGKFTNTVSLIGDKTLKVEFSKALDAKCGNVYIIGSFRKNGEVWGVSVADAKMTIAEDRLSASITYSMLPGAYNYNIIFVHKDVEPLSSVQSIWDLGVKLQNDNLDLNVVGFNDEEVNLFTDPVTVPEIADPVILENVVLKVTFDKAVPENRHVVTSGVGGWTPKEMTAADATRKVFTVTMDTVIAKTWEFLVTVSRTEGEMDYSIKFGAEGELGAQANASVTLKKDSKEVNLFGETVLELPEIKEDATYTVKITFSESMEGKVVIIKGSLTGGSWPAVVMTTEDNLTYTATVTAAAGQHKFIIGIGDTETDAASCTVKVGADGAWGAGDASITLPEAGGEVELFSAPIVAQPAE